LTAQKTIEKQWDGFDIDTLLIKSDATFTISVISVPDESIGLSARVEGEYHESVVINSVSKERSLTLSTGFSPFFTKDNDKLAAHKVLSIEMTFRIPEKTAVVIQSSSALVRTEGKIKYLETVLSEGTTTLSNFIGDARLYSQKGDISVTVGNNVGGRASSKYGSVHTEIPLQGDYFIEATSIYGDVSLRKQSGN
jgi:hypothetical protein